jgi:ACS family pantothenate transporter-like MFS transporter
MTDIKDISRISTRDATPEDCCSKDTAVATASSKESSTTPKTTNCWRRIVGYVWDTVEGDPEYRRYVTRLDRIFFPTVLLGYFIKYMDQTNYSNAFVSGMKEELHLYGNERNWLNTWFSLGVMVGSVPAQMSQLSLVRSSILIPVCELCWSFLTIGMGLTSNIKVVSGSRTFRVLNMHSRSVANSFF